MKTKPAEVKETTFATDPTVEVDIIDPYEPEEMVDASTPEGVKPRDIEEDIFEYDSSSDPSLKRMVDGGDTEDNVFAMAKDLLGGKGIEILGSKIPVGDFVALAPLLKELEGGELDISTPDVLIDATALVKAVVGELGLDILALACDFKFGELAGLGFKLGLGDFKLKALCDMVNGSETYDYGSVKDLSEPSVDRASLTGNSGNQNPQHTKVLRGLIEEEGLGTLDSSIPVNYDTDRLDDDIVILEAKKELEEPLTVLAELPDDPTTQETLVRVVDLNHEKHVSPLLNMATAVGVGGVNEGPLSLGIIKDSVQTMGADNTNGVLGYLDSFSFDNLDGVVLGDSRTYPEGTTFSLPSGISGSLSDYSKLPKAKTGGGPRSDRLRAVNVFANTDPEVVTTTNGIITALDKYSGEELDVGIEKVVDFNDAGKLKDSLGWLAANPDVPENSPKVDDLVFLRDDIAYNRNVGSRPATGWLNESIVLSDATQDLTMAVKDYRYVWGSVIAELGELSGLLLTDHFYSLKNTAVECLVLLRELQNTESLSGNIESVKEQLDILIGKIDSFAGFIGESGVVMSDDQALAIVNLLQTLEAIMAGTDEDTWEEILASLNSLSVSPLVTLSVGLHSTEETFLSFLNHFTVGLGMSVGPIDFRGFDDLLKGSFIFLESLNSLGGQVKINNVVGSAMASFNLSLVTARTLSLYDGLSDNSSVAFASHNYLVELGAFLNDIIGADFNKEKAKEAPVPPFHIQPTMMGLKIAVDEIRTGDSDRGGILHVLYAARLALSTLYDDNLSMDAYRNNDVSTKLFDLILKERKLYSEYSLSDNSNLISLKGQQLVLLTEYASLEGLGEKARALCTDAVVRAAYNVNNINPMTFTYPLLQSLVFSYDLTREACNSLNESLTGMPYELPVTFLNEADITGPLEELNVSFVDSLSKGEVLAQQLDGARIRLEAITGTLSDLEEGFIDNDTASNLISVEIPNLILEYPLDHLTTGLLTSLENRGPEPSIDVKRETEELEASITKLSAFIDDFKTALLYAQENGDVQSIPHQLLVLEDRDTVTSSLMFKYLHRNMLESAVRLKGTTDGPLEALSDVTTFFNEDASVDYVIAKAEEINQHARLFSRDVLTRPININATLLKRAMGERARISSYITDNNLGGKLQILLDNAKKGSLTSELDLASESTEHRGALVRLLKKKAASLGRWTDVLALTKDNPMKASTEERMGLVTSILKNFKSDVSAYRVSKDNLAGRLESALDFISPGWYMADDVSVFRAGPWLTASDDVVTLLLHSKYLYTPASIIRENAMSEDVTTQLP